MAYNTIAFLPYVDTEEFKFGGISFLPYYNEKTRKKISEKDKKYLDWYLSKFVDEKQKKLRVTLLSFSDKNITEELSKERINKMYDVVKVLGFLSIFRNCEISPVALENFILHIKRFKPGDRSLANSAGNYIRNENFYSGKKLTDKMKFTKPMYIPDFGFNKYPWLSDKELYSGMSNAIIAEHQQQWLKRVLRSIKLCNTSYSNSINLGIYDRILILVTAFEILLDRKSQSKIDFAETILDHIRASGNSFINDKIKRYSKKIYELRSRYSHGNSLDQLKHMHPEYGDIYKTGIYVFGIVIKSILRKSGLVEYINEEERIFKELSLGLLSKMENTNHKKNQNSE